VAGGEFTDLSAYKFILMGTVSAGGVMVVMLMQMLSVYIWTGPEQITINVGRRTRFIHLCSLHFIHEMIVTIAVVGKILCVICWANITMVP
jgi:hypothetical protein